MPKTTSIEKWHLFCRKVRDAGYVLMRHCELDGANKGIADPRAMAVCLLARTMSNLEAVSGLLRGNHVVEARTIARCCYENSFLIQGLVIAGDDFVLEMRRDEVASFKSRVEFIFARIGKPSDPEREKVLRDRVQASKMLNPKPLRPKDAADRGPLQQSYLIYSQLSGDAAHPSLTALARYVSKTREGDHTIYTVSAEPEAKPGEAVQTLEWACGAAIAVAIGVNQIYGGTPANDLLRDVMEEHVAMAGNS